MLDKNNDIKENYTVIEIKTVLNSPVKLKSFDYIVCPVCNYEIDVYEKVIDNQSIVCCENCSQKILLKIAKI